MSCALPVRTRSGPRSSGSLLGMSNRTGDGFSGSGDGPGRPGIGHPTLTSPGRKGGWAPSLVVVVAPLTRAPHVGDLSGRSDTWSWSKHETPSCAAHAGEGR